MKIRPVGAEFLHADGRTEDITKLIAAFRNFSKAPKNSQAHSDEIWQYTPISRQR